MHARNSLLFAQQRQSKCQFLTPSAQKQGRLAFKGRVKWEFSIKMVTSEEAQPRPGWEARGSQTDLQIDATPAALPSNAKFHVRSWRGTEKKKKKTSAFALRSTHSPCWSHRIPLGYVLFDSHRACFVALWTFCNGKVIGWTQISIFFFLRTWRYQSRHDGQRKDLKKSFSFHFVWHFKCTLQGYLVKKCDTHI